MASRASQSFLRAAVRTSRSARVQQYATAAETSTTPALFMDGPPAPKVQSQSQLIPFAGKRKPITPGVRHSLAVRHPHLHKGKPIKELTLARRRKGGRNDTGVIVNRFVGGGHRQRIRIVDFNRFEGGEHEVVRIEYDPGRSAHIALIRSKAAEEAEALERAAESKAASGSAAWWAPQQHKEDGKPWEHEKVYGGYSYILAPEGLRTGDIVRSYRSGIPTEFMNEGEKKIDTDPAAPQTVSDPVTPTMSTSRALGLLRTQTLKPGNVLPLYLCPPGTIVHNISLQPSGKMQLCRSAGSFGQIVSHGVGKKDAEAAEGGQATSSISLERANIERGWTLVKLQSGEVRKLHPSCVASIGVVSNKEHQQEQVGKAGRARWLGRKPRVRGVAMNACDHPHGGGRGKSKGNKHPRSVWGWLAKGKRTRRPKDKDGNKMVVTERPRGTTR